MLRRALLRGAIEPKTPDFGARDVARSLVAVPIYMVALPFALIAGQEQVHGTLGSVVRSSGQAPCGRGNQPGGRTVRDRVRLFQV